MKRIFVFLLVLVMVMPLFANGAEENSATSSEPIVIEYWTQEDAERQATEDQWIKEFEELHPNVKVNASRLGSNKVGELVQTAYAAGNGPTIYTLAINELRNYIVEGLAAPVDYKTIGFKDKKSLEKFYADGLFEGVEYDGDLYALPFGVINWCILVNKNVFRDAGLDPEKDLPKTWEDMVEVCKKITVREGDIIKRRGFDFRYGSANNVYFFVPMVEQLGGSLSETEGCVNKDAWVKVLEFMQQWGPAGENLGNPTLTAPRKLFNANNNDIAMCLTGYYQIDRIRIENPSFFESGEWTAIPFPQFKNAVKKVGSGSSGQFYAVNAEASEAEQKMAWELIEYFLFASGHEKEYVKRTGVSYFREVNKDIIKDLPAVDVFTSDLPYCKVGYYGKGSDAIGAAINTAITSVMLQGVSPEKAYETLQANVMEILND